MAKQIDDIAFSCSHDHAHVALEISPYQFKGKPASHLVFNTIGADIHLDSRKVKDLIAYLTGALENMDEGDDA